jgi:hypothetical protein
VRRLVAAGLVAAFLTLTHGAASASATSISADGGVLPPPNATVSVAGERAIVNWDGANENVVMLLDLLSTSHRTGLIVPTPAPATVALGSRDPFDVIERLIKPIEYVADDWFGTSLLPHPAPITAPAVLQRVQLGPIQATTLAATNVDGLKLWLADNNFVISAELTAALGDYVSLGWSFVAINIASSAPLTGTIDPISLTFPTDNLVYPMALSALEPHAQNRRLYILDKQRDGVVQASRPTTGLDGSVETIWAGQVRSPTLATRGKYLTVIDIHFPDPALITDDVGIQASADLSNVQPTETRYKIVALLGVPVGTLIIGWAVLGTVLLIFLGVWRRRTS